MKQRKRRIDCHKRTQRPQSLYMLLFGVFCALSWPTKAGAETNSYAQATATETNVFLGQVFNLDVIVKAGEKPDAPDVGSIADFNATVLDAGKPTSTTNTWLYRFALRAKREGELSVPALRFGSVYTKPVGIRANKPEATDRMRLEQQLSAKAVYVGEPVLLTTTWDSTYQFGAIKAVDFHFPILNDKRFQTLELHEPDKEKQANATGLPVHGTRVLATRNSYQAEGAQHQALSFSKVLIPKKSGTMAIPRPPCSARRKRRRIRTIRKHAARPSNIRPTSTTPSSTRT